MRRAIGASELIDSVPANKQQPALIAGWRRTPRPITRPSAMPQAIDELTRAIANGADDGLVWLRLAQSELAGRRTTMRWRAPTTPI